MGAVTLGCDAIDAAQDANAAPIIGQTADTGQTNTGQTSQDGGPSNAGGGQTGAGSGQTGAGGGQTGGSSHPGTGGANDGGVASPGGGDAASGGSEAGAASGGMDASGPDWGGLVTLGPSTTFGPDGAVVDGNFHHYDPDAAGPVLNAASQAACITLAENICNRSADCQVSLGQRPAEQRDRVFDSCKNTFLLAHNCNRAVRTASDFASCAEAVKARDCQAVLGSDFAASCIDKLTLQP